MESKTRSLLARHFRILIVDDHPMMRLGLAAQISDQPDMEVCGEAEDIQDAMVAIIETTPDLVLVDISLKKGHGIDLVKTIKAKYPNLKMLVVSAYAEFLYAERAMRAGARGYLNKHESGTQIIEAIRTVLDGDYFFTPEMTQRLIMQAAGAIDPSQVSPIDKLSDRELEVFRLIGEGESTGSIAKRLHLSTHTIDSHREKIKKKLNVGSGVELQRSAVQWVLENG